MASFGECRAESGALVEANSRRPWPREAAQAEHFETSWRPQPTWRATNP